MPKRIGLKYDTWLKRYQKLTHWPTVAHVVGILWKDAVYIPPDDEDADKRDVAPMLVFSVGIVIHAEPGYVVLVNEFFEDETYRGKHSFPREMIQTIIPLTQVRLFADERSKSVS